MPTAMIYDVIPDYPLVLTVKGGEGSGNFGHVGRPGEVGGSGEGGNYWWKVVEGGIESRYKGVKILYRGTEDSEEFQSAAYADDSFERAIDLIPPAHRELIGQVILEEPFKSMEDKFVFGDVDGQTIIIYMNRTQLYSYGTSFEEQFAHEVGHLVAQNVYGDMEARPWANVIRNELPISESGKRSIAEDFAETYSAFLNHNFERDERPRRYDAMKKIVNNATNSKLLNPNFIKFLTKGGEGSGNFGHVGRPGEVGGSGGGKDGYKPSSEIVAAFLAYTQLVDYDSSKIVELQEKGELQDLYNYTQENLVGDVYGKHRTQRVPFYFDEENIDSNIGRTFEVQDIMSFTSGVGVKEYKGYQFVLECNVPKSKILATSKISPKLFSLKENEFIALGGKMKVNQIIYDRSGDTGELIKPVRIRVGFVGVGKNLFIKFLTKGGEGSGHFEHEGRPGEVGGSALSGEGGGVGTLSWKEASSLDEAHEQLGTKRGLRGFSSDSSVKNANDIGKEQYRLLNENKRLEKVLQEHPVNYVYCKKGTSVQYGFGSGEALSGYYDGESITLAGGMRAGSMGVKLGGFVTGTGLDDVYRHELGHHFLKFSRPDDVGLKNFRLTYEKQPKSYWSKNVSRYGSSDVKELFSECFSAYTSPNYASSVKKLPVDVENYFSKLLKG